MTENLPKNLLYGRDHSWVKIEGVVAAVGITMPAAAKVKEFIFIKLPEKGKTIRKGETYVSMESVKWSGHLSSPVSGEITDVNSPLYDEPSRINKDPYSSWIMKVRMSIPGEKKELLTTEEMHNLEKGE
jgi:glycine cleavage system H protein